MESNVALPAILLTDIKFARSCPVILWIVGSLAACFALGINALELSLTLTAEVVILSQAIFVVSKYLYITKMSTLVVKYSCFGSSIYSQRNVSCLLINFSR